MEREWCDGGRRDCRGNGAVNSTNMVSQDLEQLSLEKAESEARSMYQVCSSFKVCLF